MNKTYHFLAGLPRSGNTLLSALFNQNPEIYSSPLSPAPALLWNMSEVMNKEESINRNVENLIKSEVFVSSFMDNFYKDVEKPVIIDRDKAWGTPSNLNLIKHFITPNPKIIFTVRDILEIIASFVQMNPTWLKNEINQRGYYTSNYRSSQDMLCDHIMSTNHDMDKSLLSLSSAFYPENNGMFHIVEYSDLVFNPEETMSKIYNFLELPYYQHDFNNIKKIEVDNDENVGLPKNLHDIRESLSQSSTDLDILSDYIRHKYSNMEFWREGSLMKIRGKDF